MNKETTYFAAKTLGARGGPKGGRARAESLSRQDRSEIARAAAKARWERQNGKVLPRETHAGILKIGAHELTCSVLDNEMRVFSTRGLSRAMGSKKTGTRHTGTGAPQLPPFLAAENLFPYLSEELRSLLNSPIRYRMKTGQSAYGYEARALPEICAALIDASAAGVLRASQENLAVTARALQRGFATVGITALVDEATGYQRDRRADALQRILEKFIAKELLPWTKLFPDEFFREIFRLRGWKWVEGTTRTPRYVGWIINAYIYGRLPEGVLEELRRLNPSVNGRRRHKHHQWMTIDVGHPALTTHIRDTWTLMRSADTWKEFHRRFIKVFPKPGDPLELALQEREFDA